MPLTLAPLTPDRLEEAAELLAARHRRDRERAPRLPAAPGGTGRALALLREQFETPGTTGVLARRDGRAVGFLLGRPVYAAPARPFAGVMPGRAAEVPYEGHAADPGEPGVLPAMYAALAEAWLDDGLDVHFATVPAGPLDAAWADLGFARFIALGVRPTGPDPALGPLPPGMSVRRAGPDDVAAVTDLTIDLIRSFADAPIFVPWLPEAAPSVAPWVGERLEDPACCWWLACEGDRPVAHELFVEPRSPHWHEGTMQAPDGSVYLSLASTAADRRGRGLGAALLGHGLEQAGRAGHAHCALHWLTASRAARFWQGCGLEPLNHWMRRAVDPRAVFGRPGRRGG